MKTLYFNNHKVFAITEDCSLICKKCGKPAKFYWFNKEKTSGQSETLHRDLCTGCYKKQFNQKPKTLHEINEERKSLK